MKHFKRVFTSSLLLIQLVMQFCVFSHINALTNSDIDDFERTFDQDYAEDTAFDNFNNLDELPLTRTPQSVSTAVALLTTAPIDLQNFLQKSIYFKTHPPRRRTLLDIPIFQHFSDYQNEQNIYFQPFYNHTYKEFFSGEESGLKYYVDMDQNNLVKKLDENNIDNSNIKQSTI